MHHFKERVCLIQMAANGKKALIDAIALSDMSPVKPLFSDPDIEKIFHGADYDIRSLHRYFQIEVSHLFDTQVAAMWAGDRETGLEAALRTRVGVSITKKYQKKDWSMRPLPPEMLDYAISDVGHLVDLSQSLKRDLRRMGRLEWVLEECEAVSRVRRSEKEPGPLFAGVKGAGRLKPRSLAALESLLKFRKSAAKKKDRPLFKIISDRRLLEIARAMPGDMKRLKALNALSPRQTAMHGKEILRRLERVRKADPSDYPAPAKRKPRRRRSRRAASRMEALKAWRDRKAGELALPQGLVCGKKIMAAVAEADPSGPGDLEKIPGMRPWRRREFGPEILSALEKV